jgi:hypothetical protein
MRLTFRLIVLFLVVLGAWLYIADRNAYRRQDQPQLGAAESEAAILANARALEAKAKRTLAEHADGRHCLDPRTGMHPGVVGWVKAHLADPASFEPVASEMTPANNHGQHLLKLTYRARRANGSPYQLGETFVVENSDCSFER